MILALETELILTSLESCPYTKKRRTTDLKAKIFAEKEKPKNLGRLSHKAIPQVNNFPLSLLQYVQR